MFVIIKKRVFFIGLSLIFAISCVIFIKNQQSVQGYVLGKTIVVDAGHGGIDGGVTGVNTGIKESEINLAVAKCLKSFLDYAGYRVVLTRSGEDSLKRGKLKDMEAIAVVIKKANADLVVSIHQNDYPLNSVKGAQVFYAPRGEYAEMATIMQNALNERLQSTRKEAKGDYYIIQCSSVPSLLIECGFLSNPTEESKLITAEYQQKVAYAIFCGINQIMDIDSMMQQNV